MKSNRKQWAWLCLYWIRYCIQVKKKHPVILDLAGNEIKKGTFSFWGCA